MELNELFLNRQSCRNYMEKEVEQEKLEMLIENARLAPSACNSQPYSFTVVSGELAKKIAKTTQFLGANKHTDKASAFIVITEEKANLLARVGAYVKSQEYASIDIGLTTSHIILTATNIGLATCIIGMFDEKKVKELLNIDENKRIRIIIAVGYADENDAIRVKKRKPLQELVSYKK